MGMIPRCSELRSLSDEELIHRYDKAAEHTIVGTGFYRDELFRREQERQANQMLAFTRQVRSMTVIIVCLTLVTTGLVVLTLVGDLAG
jgi:hypothetical protein